MNKLPITGLKIAISFVLLGYLVHQVDVGKLGNVFEHAVLGPFVLAIGFFVLSNVLGSVQWFLLLRAQAIAISFWQAMVSYFVGAFFNNVLLGNIGGDALRVYDIRRLTGTTSGGMAATLIDRFIGLFGAVCVPIGNRVTGCGHPIDSGARLADARNLVGHGAQSTRRESFGTMGGCDFTATIGLSAW